MGVLQYVHDGLLDRIRYNYRNFFAYYSRVIINNNNNVSFKLRAHLRILQRSIIGWHIPKQKQLLSQALTVINEA